MKQNISFAQFCDAFSEQYKDNFSYAGKRALFDYLEALEADTGSEIELDPIALCCEYAEYASATVCAAEYGWESSITKEDTPDDEERAEEQEEEAREWLEERTTVIPFAGGVIVQQF